MQNLKGIFCVLCLTCALFVSNVSAEKIHHAKLGVEEKHQGEDAHAEKKHGKQPGGEHPEDAWESLSTLPRELQLFFGFTWIGIIGVIPIFLQKMDDSPVTKTQISLSLALWITLFGGVYLFTNVIIFQSSHWGSETRPLTIIECIYVMSQAITTVGYGDITPAKPRGQVFVGLYVIGALCVISLFISQLIARVAKVAEEYDKTLHQHLEAAIEEDPESQGVNHSMEKLQFITGKPPRPTAVPLLKAVLLFITMDLIWICFFHWYPGEQKTWLEATYMSIITLSTVGFGAFTPVTEAGMVFAAFMMLFGSAALVSVIGNFTELMIQYHKWEQFDPNMARRALKELNKFAGSKVSETEFLRFGLLSQGIATEADLERLQKAFQEFNPKRGGIDFNDLQATVEKSLNSEL